MQIQNSMTENGKKCKILEMFISAQNVPLKYLEIWEYSCILKKHQ